MEVIVGSFFIAILLVLYGAIQVGLENLRKAGQRQELAARKLADIQLAGVAAQTQVDEIIARYDRMVDEVLVGDIVAEGNPLDVVIFSENEFSPL